MKMIMSMQVNNDTIVDLWNTLSQHHNLGLVKKLYSISLPINVYGTYQYPEKIFGIAFSLNRDIKVNTTSFENLNELKITVLDDSSVCGNLMLHIQLGDNENVSVFSSLCEDLIATIRPLDKQEIIAKEILNQIARWNKLFSKSKTIHLSDIEQQGLFGELCFLKKMLKKYPESALKVVNSWTGVDKVNKDFQETNWAVEVKTSSKKNSQRVVVNGERQLDDTFVENLFVYYLAVEVSKVSGKTLPLLVNEIRNMLKDDVSSLHLFEAKLFIAGYFEEHHLVYEKRKYQHCKESIYKVSGNFPRILEREIRQGVSDVNYTIALEMCDEFLVSESELFKALN